MTSMAERNPKEDHLLTPQNTALLIIDYQPTQINSINSMQRAELVEKIKLVAQTAKIFDLPVILSTVNVSSGRSKDTISELKEILGDIPSYDRSDINAWEDKEFYEAVKQTGRKKLLIAALWTEACMTFPTLDALKEGYDVYPIVDAVGGTSLIAHETALRRVEQAGAKLTTFAQIACELQRDWIRKDTVLGFLKLMQESGIFLKLD